MRSMLIFLLSVLESRDTGLQSSMDSFKLPPGFKLEQSQASEDPELEYRDSFVASHGALYSGYWKGKKRHGFGRQSWENGTSYSG